MNLEKIEIQQKKHNIEIVSRCLEINFEMKYQILDETWIFKNGSQVCQWVLESDRNIKCHSEGRCFTISHAGSNLGIFGRV